MEHNFLNIKEREIHPQPKYENIMINKSEITHKNTRLLPAYQICMEIF